MPTAKVSLFLPLALISLIAISGLVTLTMYKKHEMLSNSSNTTTFYQWSSCYIKLNQITCDSIENDEDQKSLCYKAAYEVGQLTYDSSPNIMDECKNFHSFLNTAQTTDMINTNDHYFNCYLSGEVLKNAYQSEFYYNQIYTPLYITCAGY